MEDTMRTLLKMFAVLFFAGTGFVAAAQTSMDYDFTIQDIEFRPDVFIDINVNVYVNENAVNWADHGGSGVSDGWNPFSDEPLRLCGF